MGGIYDYQHKYGLIIFMWMIVFVWVRVKRVLILWWKMKNFFNLIFIICMLILWWWIIMIKMMIIGRILRLRSIGNYVYEKIWIDDWFEWIRLNSFEHKQKMYRNKKKITTTTKHNNETSYQLRMMKNLDIW